MDLLVRIIGDGFEITTQASGDAAKLKQYLETVYVGCGIEIIEVTPVDMSGR